MVNEKENVSEEKIDKVTNALKELEAAGVVENIEEDVYRLTQKYRVDLANAALIAANKENSDRMELILTEAILLSVLEYFPKGLPEEKAEMYTQIVYALLPQELKEGL